MIRLYVIEDHPVILSGLRNMFRPIRDEIMVTGSAESVDEALEKAEPGNFEIIVLDLWLSDSGPLDNIALLKKRFPGKPVVIYTAEESYLWQRRMYNAGAAAYIVKKIRRPEMKIILEKVAAGEIVFTDLVKQNLKLNLLISKPQLPFKLNAHQQEIIDMLVRGFSMQKIAKLNDISISNVEKTFHHLRKLYDARNNTQLINILSELNKQNNKKST